MLRRYAPSRSRWSLLAVWSRAGDATSAATAAAVIDDWIGWLLARLPEGGAAPGR